MTATPRKSRRLTSTRLHDVPDQARIDAVLGSVYDGLVLIGGSGLIEGMNGIAERQLGVAANSAIGQPLAALGAAFDSGVRQFLAEPTSIALELSITSGGHAGVFTCRMRRFSGDGVVMALRDATAQRDFETMRSEFLLRAAHELRTPIASVHMGLGLLGERIDLPVGSRERELYETVQNELARMIELIRDLLNSSDFAPHQTTRSRVL